MMQDARPLLAGFPYATLALYGRSSPLVVFRAAAARPVEPARLDELDRLFGLAGDEGAIIYDDARRHIAKKAIARDGRLLGVRLAGETLAQAWLKQAMAEDELDASLIRLALAPSAQAAGQRSHHATSSANARTSAMCRYRRNWPAAARWPSFRTS